MLYHDFILYILYGNVNYSVIIISNTMPYCDIILLPYPTGLVILTDIVTVSTGILQHFRHPTVMYIIAL